MSDFEENKPQTPTFVPTEGRRAKIAPSNSEDDSPEYWNNLMSNAVCRWHTVFAEVPGIARFGVSGARDFECNDGTIYIVKPPHRANIAEHVVARIAAVIQAPVPNIAFVRIPQGLIDEEPSVANFRTEITHGSEYIPDLRDSRVVEYTIEQENRVRFARLAILDALTCADDRQFLYSSVKPHIVYSVDHGHYLPDNHRWNANSLKQSVAPAASETMAVNATLTNDLLCDAAEFLKNLTD